MITIGLVGGVACGKSAVARQFIELGAAGLDGDRTAHEVLELDVVKQQLVSRWGDHVLDADGRINRGAVAEIVFRKGDNGEANDELEFLEQVTHPEIGRRLEQQLQQLAETGATQVVVVDAAVMMKTGWDKICDRIGFVHAPANTRLARALQRGMSAIQFAEREAAQLSLDTKKQRSDFVIDNSGTITETQAQVREIWTSLLQVA